MYFLARTRCVHVLQGYSDDVAGSFSPRALPSYTATMQPCVDQSPDCSDQLVVLAVTGEGVPTHQKWFWVSRKVYMEVEPPFFYIMSAGAGARGGRSEG